MWIFSTPLRPPLPLKCGKFPEILRSKRVKYRPKCAKSSKEHPFSTLFKSVDLAQTPPPPVWKKINTFYFFVWKLLLDLKGSCHIPEWPLGRPESQHSLQINTPKATQHAQYHEHRTSGSQVIVSIVWTTSHLYPPLFRQGRTSGHERGRMRNNVSILELVYYTSN